MFAVIVLDCSFETVVNEVLLVIVVGFAVVEVDGFVGVVVNEAVDLLNDKLDGVALSVTAVVAVIKENCKVAYFSIHRFTNKINCDQKYNKTHVVLFKFNIPIYLLRNGNFPINNALKF